MKKPKKQVAKLSISKFQIAKISNPRVIIGGNGNGEDDDDVTGIRGK